MLPDFCSSWASLGVDVKYFLNHVLALGRDKARYQIVTVEYFLIKLARIRVFERQVPADHCVEDDAQTPYVGLKTPVTASSDHFGRRIAWTAASCLKELSSFVGVAQSEINNLYVHTLVEQEVLRLQISVADLILMEILNPGEDLLKVATGILLLEALALHYVVEELAPVGVLHYEKELPVCFNDLIELDDVWVSNYLQNLDLSRHALNVCLVRDLVLLQNFDGHALPCQGVSPQSHFPKRPLAERLPHDIVPDSPILSVVWTGLRQVSVFQGLI